MVLHFAPNAWINRLLASVLLCGLGLATMQIDDASADPPTPSYRYYRIESGIATAFDINNRGEVVGDYLSTGAIPGSGDAPFYYGQGDMISLQPEFAVAGIFDSGIVGGTDYAHSQWGGGSWARQPGFQHIDAPAWTQYFGVSEVPSYVGSTQGNYGTLPFYTGWDGHQTLPAVGCETCGADGYIYGGNSLGVMVGWGDDGQTFTGRRPIVWRDDQYSYLPHSVTGAPTVAQGHALAVNDVGTIVGYVGDGHPSGSRRLEPDYAVAWINDAPVALSTNANSYAYDISGPGASPWDAYGVGIAVGESQGVATIWCKPCFAETCDETTPPSQWTSYNLNSLLVNEEPVENLVAAYGINDCGMIVGQGATGSFVLVPADSLDTDADGLLDLWEVCGIDGDDDGSIDLTLPGADPMYRDLYVELDVMAGVNPPLQALLDVKSAFAAHDIALHFVGDAPETRLDAGNEPAFDQEDLPAQDWVFDNIDSANTKYAYDLRCQYFGSAADQGMANESKKNARLRARSMAFRYGVIGQRFTFTDSSDSNSTLGGIANLALPVFAVTLADFPAADQVVDYAVVIMHELGHAMGLEHGGEQHYEDVEDRYNRKPNYPSVMNYTWSFRPKIDAGLGATATKALQLWRDSWRLDYSIGLMAPIDEDLIPASFSLGGDIDRYVPVGLLRPAEGEMSGTVRMISMGAVEDWFPLEFGAVPEVNANYIRDSFARYTSTDAWGFTDVLEDHNDWGALTANFMPWRDYERYPFSSWCNAPRSLAAKTLPRSPRELTLAEVLALGSMRFDCNGNGIADDIDIDGGASMDADDNGIPDECQPDQAAPIDPRNDATPKSLEREFRLEVAPNPFNPNTTIVVHAPAGVEVSITAYDSRGRQVKNLFRGTIASGSRAISWDAEGLPSGVYYIRAMSDEGVLTHKISLLK